MKVIIVALALVALAVAGPVPEQAEPIKIVRSEYELTPEGPYNFSFETENGILRNEEAVLKQAIDEENKPYNLLAVRGTYSYINADGKLETVTYWADESGFHAEGESIPKEAPRQ